ncbi:LOW QUALITY PROTEIN: lipase member I-like [Molossus nigricans]
MRVYIFLCLMCWARSENKRPCLKFSELSIKDSFRDLFNPQTEMFLIMYTRNNQHCAEPLLEQDNSLNVNFNTSKKTVWHIHGYRHGSIPSWLQNFLRILLDQDDINIVVVDWNRDATTFIYNTAVENTRKIAVSLSECIQKLLEHGASLDNFHFIGVSLGAHISGFVGKIFKGQLGRITGVDPAGPGFSGKPSNGRLHHTDAKFVDIIRSDTNGLGIKEPLGHRDYYPNGGKKQPGCPKSIFADYKTGSCVECDNFKKKSCPRLAGRHDLSVVHTFYIYKACVMTKMPTEQTTGPQTAAPRLTCQQEQSGGPSEWRKKSFVVLSPHSLHTALMAVALLCTQKGSHHSSFGCGSGGAHTPRD